MKSQKSSRLDKVEQNIDILARALDKLMQEHESLKQMFIGSSMIIKDLPGYTEAVEKLKEQEENVE